MRRVWSQLERKLEEKQGKEALCPDPLLLSRPGLGPTASVYSAQWPFPVLPRVHHWLHTWQETVGVSRLDLQSSLEALFSWLQHFL